MEVDKPEEVDMSQERSELSVSHAVDAKFENFDPEGVYQIRDLGLKGATGGTFEARILAAAEKCPAALGNHRHAVTFQMVYVLKGWAKFYFEGTGEVEVAPGSCINMPGGIVHDLRDHSEDFEFIEIISPAQYDTEWMKPVE